MKQKYFVIEERNLEYGLNEWYPSHRRPARNLWVAQWELQTIKDFDSPRAGTVYRIVPYVREETN